MAVSERWEGPEKNKKPARIGAGGFKRNEKSEVSSDQPALCRPRSNEATLRISAVDIEHRVAEGVIHVEAEIRHRLEKVNSISRRLFK